MTYRYPDPARAFARLARLATRLAFLAVAIESVAGAQGTPPGAPFETRAGLTALADAAERAGRSAAAKNIRDRLLAGDFREGNRIVLEITNAVGTTSVDTVAVRANQIITFKISVPELSLRGVLRSEIEAAITEHVGKTLRNPTVRVTPLMRLAVIGAVRDPGYIDVSPGLLVSDVITRAGGYGAQADPDKIVVRRGAETVWQGPDVRIALTEGYSIDRFSLRDGDQLDVGVKAQRNWMTTTQFIIGTASLLVLLLTQAR